jgi:hypothetical protein
MKPFAPVMQKVFACVAIFCAGLSVMGGRSFVETARKR